MSDIKSLDDLKSAVSAAAPSSPAAPSAAPVRVQVRDKLGRSYATGKRKNAIARVWVKPGSGKVLVNGKEMAAYFARPVLQMILKQPFTIANVEGQFDVVATVAGGGLSGQAGAVKHGISKALQLYEPTLRGALKAAGFLTRDSRVVERKKYGKAKARRSFQFSKRYLHTIFQGARLLPRPLAFAPPCCPADSPRRPSRPNVPRALTRRWRGPSLVRQATKGPKNGTRALFSRSRRGR